MSVRSDAFNYTPPQNVATLEHDLASLMMFLTNGPDDVVIVDRPDERLLDMWFEASQVPRFSSIDEAKSIVTTENFCPWGICRSAYHQMGLKTEARNWHWRDFFSRKTSVDIEKLLPSDANAQLINNVESFEKYISSLETTESIVIKSLWSSSGRGVRFFHLANEHETCRDYVGKCIKADGGVVLEKKLCRIAELSFIYNADGAFDVNIYHSSDVGTFGQEYLGVDRLKNFNDNLPVDWLQTAKQQLDNAINNVVRQANYEGPIGIDAMLYRTASGSVALRMCTEINVRHTMGHIGCAIANRFAQGTRAMWQMTYFRNAGEWDSFVEQQESLRPLHRNAEGQIVSGFFRLTPLSHNAHFGVSGVAEVA